MGPMVILNKFLDVGAAKDLERIGSVETLNELHDALIARTIKYAEEELARLGLGTPPVLYAYLLFGSGGRQEQTIHSDQDSGLVYADAIDSCEEERCRIYFTALADKIVQNLIEIGYPPCEGGVIASNPQWCMPLNEWERKMDHWFREPAWDHVRYLLITADGRPVFGNSELAWQMMDSFYNKMRHDPVIARRMMDNTLRHKVLLGFFGQFLTERYGEHAGCLDIKYGAYIPMVNGFRWLAVEAGIRETNTLRRIQALLQAKLLTSEEAFAYSEAFNCFLKMRGEADGTGKIRLKQLTEEAKTQLRKALIEGKKVQRKVRRQSQRRYGRG